MFAKIQIRTDVSNNWLIKNPILLLGEFGLDSSVNKIKIGNGKDKWTDLEFLGEGLSQDLLTKLNGIEAGAQKNVQTNWAASTGPSSILNKPSTFTPSPHSHDITEFASTTTSRGALNVVTTYSVNNSCNSAGTSYSIDFSASLNGLAKKPDKAVMNYSVDIGPNDTFNIGMITIAMDEMDSRVDNIWHNIDITTLKTMSGNIAIAIRNRGVNTSSGFSRGSYTLNNKGTISKGRMTWNNDSGAKWCFANVPINISGTSSQYDGVSVKFRFHTPGYSSGMNCILAQPFLHIIIE